MDAHFYELVQQAARILVIGGVPAAGIALAGFGVAVAQGMLGIRDDGIQYAVRVTVLVVVILALGSTVSAACVELMRAALR